MTRVIICDMDGTIVDSMDFLRELAVSLVVADGHNEDEFRAFYNATYGISIEQQFQEWNATHDPGARLNVAKLTHYYEAMHLLIARLFPLTDFGRSLSAFRHDRHTDVRFALITSTDKAIVNTMRQLFHIDWSFIGGRTELLFDKEQQVHACLEQLRLTAIDIIYVGDAPSDLALAQRFGYPYYFPSGTTIAQILGHSVFTGSSFAEDSPSRLMGWNGP